MDRYYQLLDRDPSTISPMWKASHILCFVVIIISGFGAAYALGTAEEYFGQNCVLYASLSFLNTSSYSLSVQATALRAIPNDTVTPFNMWYTQWGSINICYFCQFTPLCSAIFGIIWCTLFIICSRGGAGYMTDEINRPWRLIYPTMIYTLISSAIMLVSLLKVSAGIKHFCAEFKPIFNTTRCTDDIDIYTQAFHPSKKPLISVLQTGLTFTSICFFAGLAHFCVILLRIINIVDFQMILITVSSSKHEKEYQTDDSQDKRIGKILPKISGSSFAFPVKVKDDLSPIGSVPIAESESLNDDLSISPRSNKQIDTVVHLIDSSGNSNASDYKSNVVIIPASKDDSQ